MHHGLYFLGAVICLLVVVIWAGASKRFKWLALAVIQLIVCLLVVPDSHEFRSSQLNNVMGQIFLILAYVTLCVFLLMKFIRHSK